VHHTVVAFPRRRTEEGEERFAEGVEVGDAGDKADLLHAGEQIHTKHRKDEEEEEEDPHYVAEGGEGEEEGLEEVQQQLASLDEAKEPRDAEDSKKRRELLKRPYMGGPRTGGWVGGKDACANASGSVSGSVSVGVGVCA